MNCADSGRQTIDSCTFSIHGHAVRKETVTMHPRLSLTKVKKTNKKKSKTWHKKGSEGNQFSV